MAQENQDIQTNQGTLSERVEGFRREIQSLIKQGVEHPRFEFKRSASISNDNLDDRLDFIKFLQGMANAEITGERCIILGGDPKEKRFYPVLNTAEFDQATVLPVLAKYLDPVPRFEVFNNLQTDSGEAFVLIILDENQPRPIVVKTESKRSDGKIRLQIGDIWIKKGTALQLVSRADLDAMYRARMEEEAEDRARKRFKHFSEISSLSPLVPPPNRLPTRKLLAGPAQEFSAFVEELIATNDAGRFSMLLELTRESLVDGWDNLTERHSGHPSSAQQYVLEVNNFFRDSFLPSLQSLVSVGMLTIKYDSHADWLRSAINILLEAFEASKELQRLKSGWVVQGPDSLPSWRPAFEVYVSVRSIAVYAVRRDKLKFLGPILPQFVKPLSIGYEQRPITPFMFWPLPSNFDGGDFTQGRSALFWKERISTSWGNYFGKYEKFLGPACELEFVLELNSYLGTNGVADPELQRWLETNRQNTTFFYVPDLYAYDLQRTVRMAERCYDLIASDKPFPADLAVEPALFALAFKQKTRDQRLLIYGGFLHHLRTWQETAMLQQRRFPFSYNWEGRLLEIVKRYREQLPRKTPDT